MIVPSRPSTLSNLPSSHRTSFSGRSELAERHSLDLRNLGSVRAGVAWAPFLQTPVIGLTLLFVASSD